MDIPTIQPYRKEEILGHTRQAWKEVEAFVASLSPEAFYQKPAAEVWSAAENLEHLMMSTQPLVQGLGMPKIALKALGKPNRPVRTYPQLVSRYQDKLSQLDQAPISGFKPKVDGGEYIGQKIADWKSIGDKYFVKIQGWKDEDLDKYLMPHPLLGKLMIREMLFFTLYHTWHHLEIMHKRAGQLN